MRIINVFYYVVYIKEVFVFFGNLYDCIVVFYEVLEKIFFFFWWVFSVNNVNGIWWNCSKVRWIFKVGVVYWEVIEVFKEYCFNGFNEIDVGGVDLIVIYFFNLRIVFYSDVDGCY